MELKKINTELRELTFDQASNINGGESGWYWVSLGIGATGRAICKFLNAVHDTCKQPDHLIGVK
ncbi:MAG: hypothetical protein EAZ13_04045 [Sphingobacteriia bacterium]|nr:MAG: hypothetical protein EAZ35_07600 [Sphingobacteriia bacterium]TAH08202.1 MAG: hypothetical protein EAZ13_04045 [Sphingobacteriia bacterium]